ncbi:MAG: DUF885 domain-containing protein [Parahaliea sp.]
MLIKTLLTPAAITLLLFLSNTVHASWVEKSNRYALEVLSDQASISPEWISSVGLPGFDSDVSEIGPDIVEREITLNRSIISRLEKQRIKEQNPKVQQDIQIMISSLTDSISRLELERKYLLPYYDIPQLLYYSFNALLDPRVDAKRYPAAIERLRKYNGQAEAYRPLTEQAKARTTALLDKPELLGPYIDEVQNNLESAPHYIAGLRALFEQSALEGWEQDLALLEQQLKDYSTWVADTVLVRARKDNRLPLELYINELRSYGVSASPQELIAEGQYSYQLIRSQMKALARQIADKRGWQQQDLVSVIHKLKEEQVPQDKLLALYQQRLKTIEDIIEREQLVSLPERKAVIRLATEAESAASPASFMSPPQLINNTGQYGEFVLVQSNPALGADAQMDDWSHDAIIWALTVHEARPGHELQYSRLVEDGTSLARALFAFNSANAEGWGLYAESIMQAYLPLEGQLFNLYTRLLRAARMFLDPMVNTGQISRDEAEHFLIEETAMSLAMASSEADRYAFRAPGQATSYYVGYVNLMRLRTEVELRQGDDFDDKAFHDFILSQGILPPQLLREAVLEQFVSQ